MSDSSGKILLNRFIFLRSVNLGFWGCMHASRVLSLGFLNLFVVFLVLQVIT